MSAARLAAWMAVVACASAHAAAVHTVAIDGTAYVPQVLTVKRGDTVRWINNDPFPHTVTARDHAFDSKTLAAGKSWRFVARKTGEFAYFCTLHPTMTGTLKVE